MQRTDLRPNPFNPEDDFVHADLEKLFIAIDDIQRDHKYGRKEPRPTFDASVDKAIEILKAMKETP